MKRNFLKKTLGCLLALSLAATSIVPVFAEEETAEEETEVIAEEETEDIADDEAEDAADEAEDTADEGTYQLTVGTAIRDITPTEENGLLPIDGVGRTTLVGVIDEIDVRVIALSDGETTSLMVISETGRGPYGPQYVEALSEHTGLPVEAIYYGATHAHAVPEVTDPVDLDYDDDDPEVTNLQRWAKYVQEQMFDAADEALSTMEPATMGIATGESYINVNRNRTYTDENGETYRSEGYNPTGPSDKTLTVLEFDNMDGDPIAFIIQYAMHNTVMYANECIDGETGVSSDVSGFVSKSLEELYDGCVAMWISGAAGDQNPIYRNQYFTPSVEGDDYEASFIPGGDYDIVKYLGKIQLSDVKSVIADIDDKTSDVKISYAYGETSIPAEEDYEEDEFPLSLSLLRIGDVAFVGCAGELFTSIGMYMKENSELENTLVCNHIWTHEGQFANYMTDDEGKELGGAGTMAQYQEGYINDALTDLMNEMIEETN